MPKTEFSEDLKRVYLQFPASYRSKYWPEIVRAVEAGDIAAAKSIARENERRHKSIRAENVIARRVRIERASLFVMQRRAREQLEAIFQTASDPIVDHIGSRATRAGAIPSLREDIRSAMSIMRRQLNKWMTDHIWFAIKIGFRNMGDALQPILDANKDALKEDLEEVALIEERLFVGLTPTLAGRAKADAPLNTKKWDRIATKIYGTYAKQNVRGLKPSERVWDLTTQIEANLKRLLVNGIARAEQPRDIANNAKRYLAPEASGIGDPGGPGVYRSPFKNAMRIVRTETISAYNSAVSAWVKDKEWIEGIRVTLSSAHTVEDECDDWAGQIVTPAEWETTFPIHPHCMCQPTPVPKSEFLADFEKDAALGAVGSTEEE